MIKQFFIAVAVATMFFSCNQQNDLEKTRQLIQTVKQKYVPDSRDKIFNIYAENQNNTIVLKGYTDYPLVLQAIDSILEAENIQLLDSTVLLPDESVQGLEHALVRISVANLRKEPVIKSELVSQALMGMSLKLFRREGSWFLLQTPDKYYGWMYAPALIQVSDSGLSAWENSEKLIVTKIYTHAFAQPDISAQKISDLLILDKVKLTGEQGDFYEVELPDGRKAYVLKSVVSKYKDWYANRKAKPENIKKSALQFLGVPYMWGGTSAKQFDCSGFTQTVYKLNGIQLPRDASQQIKLGKEMDTSAHFTHLQAGDLLFFGKKASATNKEKVIHVAIYLGDTEFIHAAGLVKINSLDPARENYSPYRKGSFLRAKRILNDI